jgi:hypothetical protein
VDQHLKQAIRQLHPPRKPAPPFNNERAVKLPVMAVAFGLGSVVSNRAHGDLGAHLKDRRYARRDDDDHKPNPLAAIVLTSDEKEIRKILI